MFIDKPLYQTVTITTIHQQTNSVKSFTILSEDGEAIPYIAGQFITFVFLNHGKEERRSFSISSSPVLNEPLTFTVKRIDNGAYSRLLTDRVATGDKLQTTGAGGLFTLPVNTDSWKQVFFFVAGIGITPVFSLIKTLLHTQGDKNVVLIYSNRSKEEVVFYNELQALVQVFPHNFRMELLYSTSFNLARARLNKNLLSLLMSEYAVVPKEQMLCYICGPSDYMRMAAFALKEYGITTDRIKKENFNPDSRHLAKKEPPDKSAHDAIIKTDQREFRFSVQYPDTILQAAKKFGLSLPYSCETGSCGSCTAICTSGKVWLSYNEVLTETDLQKGLILTCVGHPVGGDVFIEYK
jgi:ferredoxin-NADP reductase